MIPFSADLDLTTRVFRVVGFHIAETAGAAAVVNLRNGSVTGDIFVQVRLPAIAGGNSIHHSFTTRAQFPKGLFVDVVSGTVVGAIQQG